MSILIPAIKGRLGNTDFYEATMNVRDLVQAVRPPLEMDDWANFGIEERMQREPEKKRIQAQLAPYIAKNPDRFFGSIVVLMYSADVEFEPMTKLTDKLPQAYKKNGERLGFLTIDGGTLVVLDGQHRLLALRMVLNGEVTGAHAAEVSSDEVCVVFIKHEDFTKTRRIFNTINRYAKPTSRSDNILTSEDDGYAIVARRLLRDDGPLHARKNVKSSEDVVDWKSNTLSARSTKLTTISVVYSTVKRLLEHAGEPKLNAQDRPSDEDLDRYLEICSTAWSSLLNNIAWYREALHDVTSIPELRKDSASSSLLFKPAAQIAVVNAIADASELASNRASFDDIVKRVNEIKDWSMTASIWRDIMIKAGGAIDTKSDAMDRMTTLLTYLLAADVMDESHKLNAWKVFNAARHPSEFEKWEEGIGPISELEDLPTPTVGKKLTVEDAKRFSKKAA